MVRFHEDGDQLSVEICDDCLTNMEARLDALGGTLRIVSSPGNGTTLRATIPVPSARAAG